MISSPKLVKYSFVDKLLITLRLNLYVFATYSATYMNGRTAIRPKKVKVFNEMICALVGVDWV
jgi:hypothetical protein